MMVLRVRFRTREYPRSLIGYHLALPRGSKKSMQGKRKKIA